MKIVLLRRSRLFYIVCLLFAISNAGGQTQTTVKDQKQVPRFETAACAVQIPEGVKAECGNLYVKENRQKAAGRIIRLPVVIIKSTSPNPLPDPVFYTAGGPGASSLGRVRGAENLVPFTKDRDFIIFEQRGTRYAEPNLQCPEVNDARHRNWEQNLSSKQAAQKEAAAAKVCRARLIRDGVDLATYNSAASAADIEDLRVALKIKQFNLYGISYSTRLMLNYIREYPGGVRSVILDSVLPPTVNWDETDVDGIIRSLDVLFDHCARDAKCSAAYPKLKERLYAAIDAANKKPVAVEVVKDGKTLTVSLDGNAVFDYIYNLLEDNGALGSIPSAIDALAKGNFKPLKPYAENQLTSEGFIWGMRYSVWCREEMPFQNRRKIAAQDAKYPGIKGFKVQGAFPEICQVWNIPAAGAIENQPVKSSIPALIFAGGFDPDTPPAWGKLVASWFPNSFFYEVESSTHGVINNRCTFVEITASFVNNPAAKPNDACLSSIPPVVFKIDQ